MLDVDRQFLADIARFFDDLALDLEKPPVEEYLRSRHLGDMNIRLAGAHQQANAILANDLACQRLQVFAVELLIQLRARVDDASVDRRTDRDSSRPVLGGQHQFQRAQMHVGHRDETLLLQQTSSPLSILETYGAQQHAAPQIEFLAIRQEFDGPRIEPVLIGDPKLEREPIGEIDEILVLDHPAGNIGAQSVVAAGEVGPRIVNVIRHRPGRGRTRVAK